MTSIEREEKEKVKKREKKLEDEETLQQATWVKYTFPIKHQVHLKLARKHLLAFLFLLICWAFFVLLLFLCEGLEAEGGGVSRHRLRWLELDQSDLCSEVPPAASRQHQRQLSERTGRSGTRRFVAFKQLHCQKLIAGLVL